MMAALAAFLLRHAPPLPLPHLSSAAALVVGLFIPLAGGIGGSLVTQKDVTGWYQTSIVKPWWTPPGWLFGPVWTALYASMGVASFRVYKALGPAAAGRPLSVYLLQLLLNFAWTPVFFRAHALGAATLVIALMWLAILGTIAVFSTVLGPASAWALLGPYLGWVSYAGSLTAWIWRHNPSPGAGRREGAAVGRAVGGVESAEASVAAAAKRHT